MAKEEATGRIKILKIPDGEAPQWVRGAWVGLILPCYPYIGTPSCELSGVLSGDKVEDSRRGVIVSHREAISVLIQHDREAAMWWMTNDFGKDGGFFFFFEDDIGIVSGVSEAPMRVFDDMETGHWEELNTR